MGYILVIEDEDHIRENIVEILRLEGYTVDGAANGHEGVQKAQNLLPDLVLCDIMMPEKNGFDVLIELRNAEQTATTPLIFLTALVDRKSSRHAMILGADDYISKPFSPDELVAAVESRLKRQALIEKKYHSQMETLRQNIIHALPHELRTPLTSIIGCADFLTMYPDQASGEQIAKIGSIIERSAQRMQGLVENYLLFAQVELTRNDPHRIEQLRREIVDLPGALIFSTAEQAAFLHDRQEDLHIDTENVSVAVDGGNLAKIARELIDNAFKFSPPGSLVQISAASDPQTQTYQITVTDVGRGMTREDINRIGAYIQFERTLYEQQGLGLGLVIVQRLVDLHRGQLHIESDPGSYTTVTVKLPLADTN